jgi:microcystin-dependent protein
MESFVGQLLLVGFNFAPIGWMFCQGQLLDISQNSALFSLIGTTYGGDGVNTFGLPDLRGRTTLHQGQPPGGANYVVGEKGGQEAVTLTSNQMPAHNHPFMGAGEVGNSQHASGTLLGNGQNIYSTTPGTNAMADGVVSTAGGSQPHDNLQPFLTLNWIISLEGIYPSHS